MELDIVCFSPIRWEAEIQRPQELMRRAAKECRVFYIEEPACQPGTPQLKIEELNPGALWKVVPTYPEHLSDKECKEIQRLLIQQLLEMHGMRQFALLIYNPSAIEWARYLRPHLTIYDCLTRFKAENGDVFVDELKLLHGADLVVNDSQTAIRGWPGSSGNQRWFPGSLDVEHFLKARTGLSEPRDQSRIPRPRLGFWGVINCLMDWRLVEAVAKQRPSWQFVLLGPITDDPGSLFERKNIHYLCTRSWAELPAYLAGWDVAILPLTKREHETCISASQIPQYLAGGCPVVTTNIPEIERCFGRRQLVYNADTPEAFIRAVEKALAWKQLQPDWLAHVDRHLADAAWDLA